MLWPKTANKHREEATTRSTQEAPNQKTKTNGARKLQNKEKIRWFERTILGGDRTRKHYNKWQRIRRTQWDWLLDAKRDAASVAEGVSQMEPTTQRLKPAPQKKKKSARTYGF